LAYIGRPASSTTSASAATDTFIGNGTATFQLSRTVDGNPSSLEVFVSNVQQQPVVTYTVSGSTLIFTEAPGNGEPIYVIFRDYPVAPVFTVPNNSVSEIKLQSESVSTIKLQNGAVTTAKIGSGNITSSLIADDAITEVKIADNAVTENKIADNAVTTTKIFGQLPASKGGTGLDAGSATNGQLIIGNGSGFTANTITGTTNRVTVTNGVGSITLTSPQDIATTSNVQFGSFGVGTAASNTVGEIRATNNITAFYSDRRLKTNIVPIADALKKLCEISGVTFQSNDVAFKYGYTDQKVQVGVIAQEVQKVLPQIVVPAPFDIGKNPDGSEYSISGENYVTVHYDKLIPLLIEAIKDLKAEVDQLKNSKG
jgi:hypothetical protein